MTFEEGEGECEAMTGRRLPTAASTGVMPRGFVYCCASVLLCSLASPHLSPVIVACSPPFLLQIPSICRSRATSLAPTGFSGRSSSPSSLSPKLSMVALNSLAGQLQGLGAVLDHTSLTPPIFSWRQYLDHGGSTLQLREPSHCISAHRRFLIPLCSLLGCLVLAEKRLREHE